MGLKKPSLQEPLHQVVEREHARDAAGLVEALRHGDAEQRRWAARDLAAHPQTAALLGEHLAGETDSRVRDAAFVSLTAMASDAAAAALMPLLRTEDAELRNGAIEALAAMPQAVAPRMTGLLRDADPDVRIFSVNLLTELRHPQVRPWLQQVLARDAEVNVVAAAIEVMAEVGTPDDAPALQAVRGRFPADPFIGFAVDMAIDRIVAS